MSSIYQRAWSRIGLMAVVAAISFSPALAQDGQGESKPFQLGVGQTDYIPTPAAPSYSSYPAFQAPQKPAPPPPKPPQKPPQKPLQAGTAQMAPQNVQRPLNGGIQQQPQRPLTGGLSAPPGVLPTQFLGQWAVQGSRSNIEALPQYQDGIGNIFQMGTQNSWTIAGNPNQGYSITSDSGVSTQLVVQKVENGAAFLRYQHQIKNTFAQEAVVIQLSPDGMTFSGLERISIVKPGEQAPRAKVTYQLQGRRLR